MDEQNNVVEQVEQQPQEQAQAEQPVEKTFTQKEVDEIVKKRLAKEQSKFEARLNALEENAKLQAMDEKQKAEYQTQKEREQFEAERQAFYEERDKFNKAQYKMTIEKQLQEKGLPTSMADLLTSMDAEQVNSKINELTEQFGASVNAQIENRLKQTSTPQEPTQRKQLFTLQEIQAMSIEEYRANKALVEESLKNIYKK